METYRPSTAPSRHSPSSPRSVYELASNSRPNTSIGSNSSPFSSSTTPKTETITTTGVPRLNLSDLSKSNLDNSNIMPQSARYPSLSSSRVSKAPTEQDLRKALYTDRITASNVNAALLSPRYSLVNSPNDWNSNSGRQSYRPSPKAQSTNALTLLR